MMGITRKNPTEKNGAEQLFEKYQIKKNKTASAPLAGRVKRDNRNVMRMARVIQSYTQFSFIHCPKMKLIEETS